MYEKIVNILKMATETQDTEPIIGLVENARGFMATAFLMAIVDHKTTDPTEAEFLSKLKESLQTITREEDR